MVLGLVFRVCDMLHVPVPTSPAALTLIALSGCWAVTTFIDDRGQMSPGIAGLAVVLRVA